MKQLIVSIWVVLVFCLSYSVHAQETTRLLSLEDAQRISDAAESRARQDNWNVVIAILDAGGHLVALRRMDGTQIGSVDVGIQKATSALKFKRPTKVFEDAVKSGNVHIISLPGVVAVEGGLPIRDGDRVIGSIGVSGVTSAQDGIIAAAGLESF
ncbi:GlcG/HbpS family heme-binding protein [Cyclobacterium jeungdonense]|uniref:Heme-binding protein n=1 Tax=Cyclobacterium jeungdonense TaxID=708087 RepID=A0ABT8C4I3_9BACT|nr:heme-binding protein [Cyclobacterium jeungdonense]MDN3687698.1 heme-binding protein [Cyclobacterium jeungdonense]